MRLARQPSAVQAAACAAQLGKVRPDRRSNSRHVVATAAMIGKASNESRERAAFLRRASKHVELGAIFHLIALRPFRRIEHDRRPAADDVAAPEEPGGIFLRPLAFFIRVFEPDNAPCQDDLAGEVRAAGEEAHSGFC
jgi:hypothetical protein